MQNNRWAFRNCLDRPFDSSSRHLFDIIYRTRKTSEIELLIRQNLLFCRGRSDLNFCKYVQIKTRESAHDFFSQKVFREKLDRIKICLLWEYGATASPDITILQKSQ